MKASAPVIYILDIPLLLLTSLVIIGLLLARKELVMPRKTEHDGFNIIFAMGIDLFIYFLSLGLIGFLTLTINYLFHFPIYYYLLEIFYILILSSNVLFTSLGFRICKIYCPRYKIPILFNNAFYVSLFTIVINENNLIIYIIVGLYSGIDSLFIVIKRKPFIYFLFKINIYEKLATIHP
jgi:hypothetical protein